MAPAATQLYSLYSSPLSVSVVILGSVVIYAAGCAFYNLFLHPLSRFPGPISHSISRLPYCIKLMRGTLPFDVLDLHERYGDIVRLAPNELVFSNPQAWKDIMGHRKGQEEMTKYPKFYKLNPSEPDHIVNAPREMHSRLRRQLAHGFSDKSMREQEPLVQKYIELFIQRLRESSERDGDSVDIASFFNFTTFDLIGDLAFAEPFGCLENCSYHPWVKMILTMARAGTFMQSANFYPAIKYILLCMVPASLKKVHDENAAQTKAKLARRMEKGERPDLMQGLLGKKEELNLSLGHLEVNANMLVVGGSETTATLLSGVTYLLLTNPVAMETLKQEVRSSFGSSNEISIASVSTLNYMLACLDEALRMYPPVPIGNPRQVPRAGGMICGEFIPGDTVVSVYQWAAYHREKHFKDPFTFHPERHMNDAQFADDKRDIFQPFSLGPRNCIGRNLAYTEMRLILAHLMYEFDMEIADESKNWMGEQKIYFLWERAPLKVQLKPVTRR